MKKEKFLLMTLMLTLSSMVYAQSPETILKDFGNMLNQYCLTYYKSDFPDRYYQKGSLSVNTSEEDIKKAINALTGNFFLEGTHSYKGKLDNSHSNVKWQATIRQLGDSKYKVKFDKWYEKDPLPGWLGGQPAHWEEGRVREIIWDGFTLKEK